MKIKLGANIQGLKLEMRRVLVDADSIWKYLGQELVITSGLDGTHSAGSLHYYGYAVDLRTNYFNEEEKLEAVRMLKESLPHKYDVILEQTHIHVEYNILLEQIQ